MEHRFDVVLVFHTSRFARNTVEAKRYKKLLRSELGIDVISVTQPLGADADDPAAFLSESVHEIFDEYYSVSLSFWTKMGLREKARQGLLTGSLPWGYVKGEDGIAQPDPERAPYVRQLFEMYATGRHTDRTLAEWLNVNEQRTARDRAFGVDTVREMLCNAAYAGYVSARRDTTKTIKGLHEPIIEEALFDRVQEMRRQRARTLKPGRPSQRYLLRGLARCERCQGKMQGTAIGRKLVPRYYCATRRADHSCDQPLVHADLVEDQLVEFIADFKPTPAIRNEILRRLTGTTTPDQRGTAQRRASLEERLRPLPRPLRTRRPRPPRVHGPPRRHQHRAGRTRARPDPRPRPGPPGTRRLLDLLAAGRPTPPPSASFLSSSSSASGWTSSASSPSSPSPPSRPSFENRAPRNRRKRRCVKSGSDGTRTRDLRRDRPAL